MPNKLYEESSVQSIADAIRAKNGTTTKYKIGEMAVAVQSISGAVEAIEWHQCPEAVRNYLANVTYDPNDYNTSQIASYAPTTAVVSNYKPIGKTVGGVTYYNEVPNALTPFAGGGAAGTLKPLDALRWIRTRDNSAEAWNVRDLGGWACDGGTVKYGLLIRGGRISAADRAVLVGQLGVQHDIDLRGKEGRDPSDDEVATESPLGMDVWFTIADKAASYALTPVATWQLYLRCVIDAVTHREPVYFHCTAGADRTGTLACVLEGILGVSQSDIDKDYELTCFYSGTETDALARRRNEPEWKKLITEINAVSGGTFRDKCVHFAVGACGMSMSDINAYRTAMINGIPETLHWYQPITKNLTGCAISNAASQVDYGDTYNAVLSPDSGKTLNSVVIKMGGADITASSYSSSSGTINIAKVTAEVTINATASEHSAPRNIIEDIGISAETRLSAGSGTNKSQAGWATIGANMDATSLIHLKPGDVLRIKGMNLPATSDSNSIAVAYNETATFISASYIYNGYRWSELSFVSDGETVTVTASAEHFIRVSLPCADTSAVIATINEPIP